jgi:hypothetical protein
VQPAAGMPTTEVHAAAAAPGAGVNVVGVTRKGHLTSTGRQESDDSAYGEGGGLRESTFNCAHDMGITMLSLWSVCHNV